VFWITAFGIEESSMSDQFWLSEEQVARIAPFFPLSHGVPRVDDRRGVSGIIHVIRYGLRWRVAPEVYGPHQGGAEPLPGRAFHGNTPRGARLHAVCDGQGRPLRLRLPQGQQSDHKGAAILLRDLPPASELIGDKGYDSDAYREALLTRGITPCIPPRAKRKHPAKYCKTLYKQRHKVENLFARLKGWRRIAMRYDRCHMSSSQPSASQQ